MKHLVAAAALALALPAVASAQVASPAMEQASVSRASQIEQVLRGALPAEEVFSKDFLDAVPASALRALMARLVEAHGPIVTIDDVTYKGNGAAQFDLVFAKGRAVSTLQLDGAAPHKVAGFVIGNVTPLEDTPRKVLEEIAALPGQAAIGAYLLTQDGPQPVYTQNSDRQLAVGSTFKLYVLAALAKEIKAGKREWADVVVLDAASIPSGQMQDWPVGAPVTLHTLATMMISISDNTATDVLMRVLGREVVEAEVLATHSDPTITLPLFTTVEFFALKHDPARIAAYQAADEAGQRALLEQWAPTLTAQNANLASLIAAGPTAIDSIEWFASSHDIARILARLRDLGDQQALDILGITPVIGDEAAWDYVGYKGGSETGVLNLSWLLKDRQGRWFAVSASWNDPSARVDDGRLVFLAQRLIGMLQQ